MAAVAIAAASVARSTLGTIGVALACILLLPIAGVMNPIHPWLPSTLVTAPIALLTGLRFADFLRVAPRYVCTLAPRAGQI